ncbi:MAG: type II secretion system protein [Magnetococcales bacterium]|nr:type II secretion system protein [Magnetococcales bacterium]
MPIFSNFGPDAVSNHYRDEIRHHYNSEERTRQAGVTLIELIIFLVLLGIIVSSLSTVMFTTMKDPLLARKIHQASLLIQEVTEEITYEYNKLTPTQTLSNMKSFSDDTPVSGFSEFNRTISVNTNPGKPPCPASTWTQCWVFSIAVTDSTTGDTYGSMTMTPLIK